MVVPADGIGKHHAGTAEAQHDDKCVRTFFLQGFEGAV